MINAIRELSHRGSTPTPTLTAAQTKLGMLVQVLSQQISEQAAGPFGMVIVQAATFLARKLEGTDPAEQARWSEAIAAIAVTLADPTIDIEHFQDRLEAVLDEAFRADSH